MRTSTSIHDYAEARIAIGAQLSNLAFGDGPAAGAARAASASLNALAGWARRPTIAHHRAG